jgi:DNA-binding NtrC family response regulator
MKEMFIKKGFSDFLAKPIDISRLDEILASWIPIEKMEKKNENIEDSY